MTKADNIEKIYLKMSERPQPLPVEVVLARETEQLSIDYQERLDETDTSYLAVALDDRWTAHKEDAFTVISDDPEHTRVLWHIVDGTVVPPNSEIIKGPMVEYVRGRADAKLDDNLRNNMFSLSQGEFKPTISIEITFEHEPFIEGQIMEVRDVRFTGIERTKTRLLPNLLHKETDIEGLNLSSEREDQAVWLMKMIEIADSYAYVLETDQTKLEDTLTFYSHLFSQMVMEWFHRTEVPYFGRINKMNDQRHAPISSPTRDFAAFVNLHNLVAAYAGSSLPFPPRPGNEMYLDRSTGARRFKKRSLPKMFKLKS